MRIDKLEISKEDGRSILKIELYIDSESGGYDVVVYNHINRKNKIDITNDFYEDNNRAYASIPLDTLGITNTSVIILEVEDASFNVFKGVTTDVTNYFKCLVREILTEVDDDCENCKPGNNENLLQLSAILNAFKDAAAIGALDELIQIALLLDKLCNTNCKTCE